MSAIEDATEYTAAPPSPAFASASSGGGAFGPAATNYAHQSLLLLQSVRAVAGKSQHAAMRWTRQPSRTTPLYPRAYAMGRCSRTDSEEGARRAPERCTVLHDGDCGT